MTDPQPISVTESTDPIGGAAAGGPSGERSELYLIAHRVRGEPAFDIAQRSQIGDEEGWIIPTSGHRAYPYDFIALSMVSAIWITELGPMPPDLPDHYACN